MKNIGHNLAEDSSFIKYQYNNVEVAGAHSHDVEGGVKEELVDSVVGKPVIVSENTPQTHIESEVPDEKQTRQPDESSVTALDDKDDFPEGGLKAWSVVVGAFCGGFSVFGIINSTAVLLDYFQQNQLKDKTASQIGWIFGLGLFATFFLGAPVGPIFDAYGPRALIFAGSILLVLSMFLLGECTEYWHFFMVYSVLNGIGGCLIVSPCTASVGHFFLVRRGNATGIAMTSGSIGGIIFPLILQPLIPKLGFKNSMRIIGGILFVLLIVANLTVRSRLPRKKMTSLREISPDISILKDAPFALLTLGIFLMEWAIFVPLTFITNYATTHGHSNKFGFQILAILNGGSFFGRFLAGILADMMGRVNTLIITIFFCAVSCFGLWLPAGESTPMIVVFAVIFGFVSGSNLSLSPVCVGQMCKTEHYGRYFASCWMFVSFGTLTALPIAGQILTANGGNYEGVIIFAGLAYTAACLCLIAARVLRVGWKINIVY
ncbi:hypothetical protein HYFRA_00004538 [Hymenoscyphus fraxineus]|uniref:Major facilitator superfamily (MFS) profile domain-containing protein n=1 Tax=Hymenoscyphus fraxineus TaxID=746836 RepID=A0A9N9PIM3_9HELO|nr:hypothetical protein HYFRA_00004538 [Hymenoscyphus fraxineus]